MDWLKPSWVVKTVLRLRIAATSMSEYVSGWCGHGFESHSQPFLLTYPEVDLSLWRLVFYFHGQRRGGLSHCGHFSEKGEGMSILRNFVRTSFMERPKHNFNNTQKSYIKNTRNFGHDLESDEVGKSILAKCWKRITDNFVNKTTL